MSEENFSLEYDTQRPPVVTDAERVERLKRLTAQEVYPKLGMWDQDFVTDVVGLKSFSVRQRFEADRIWNQWGAHC